MTAQSNQHRVRPIQLPPGTERPTTTTPAEITPEWIATARRRAGLSQKQAAQWLNISPSYISKLEAGQIDLSANDDLQRRLRNLSTIASRCPNCWLEDSKEQNIAYLHSPADLSPESLDENEHRRQEAIEHATYRGPYLFAPVGPGGQRLIYCRYCGDRLIPGICPNDNCGLPTSNDPNQIVCEYCGTKLLINKEIKGAQHGRTHPTERR